MRVIHRFEFDDGMLMRLSLNRDAKVVMVHQKGARIHVWIEHDPNEQQNYGWVLRLFSTGMEIPDDRTNARDNWRHQGSCAFDSWEFYHLYVKVEYL